MWARPNQKLPNGPWRTWMIRAGRGFGKTRAAAEGVRKLVATGKYRAGTIIGRNPAEARDVMVDGESGLVTIHPPEVRPKYEPSKRLLTWPNGAVAHVRSAEDPDSIRGLNSDWVWGDEPASWRTGKEAWDQAMLGNRRLGEPRSILSGTPRPLPWLKELEAKPTTVVTVGSTYDNMRNLADAFIELILERYEGSRLGAQELHARYLEDVEGALWTLRTIEQGRFMKFDRAEPWKSLALGLALTNPHFGRGPEVFTKDHRRWVTAVGVDPPGETAECGIIVATAPRNGIAARDHAVVLDDMTIAGPPEAWGPQVVAAAKKWNADVVIVESNQGGDQCRFVIHSADPTLNVEKVRAQDSKADRAEPISVLYAKGWIHHWGNLSGLEDQMATWVPDESKSPDRIDAAVHVLTHLLRPTTIGRASLYSATDVASERL
jgi:phage terminase large subunit-like protein